LSADIAPPFKKFYALFLFRRTANAPSYGARRSRDKAGASDSRIPAFRRRHFERAKPAKTPTQYMFSSLFFSLLRRSRRQKTTDFLSGETVSPSWAGVLPRRLCRELKKGIKRPITRCDHNGGRVPGSADDRRSMLAAFVYASPRRTAIALKLPDEWISLTTFRSNLLI